jgi:metal transporter CNNM
MYLMYPVAYPTALLLDYILGQDHGTVYKKAGLKTLVTLHKSLGPHPGERLNQDEVTIISAVLDLKEKPVGAIMTPIKDVFTMSSDTILDEDTMAQILSAGYSRIPIHAPGEPTNFIGMLLVKVLITYDPEDARPVSSFPLATLPETAEDTSCLDILNFFQEGKSHMVLVSEYPGENHGALGVVTLEDVIEELIGEEIVDESDVFIDVTKAIRRLHPSPFALSSAAKRQISATYISRNADPEAIAQTASAIASTAHSNTSTDLLITNSGVTAAPVDSELHHSIEAAMARGRKGSGARLAGLSDDVIAHLTLGPANVAVRPRETTSKTVKIKHVEGGRKSEDLLRSHNNNSGYGSRYTSAGYASASGDGTAALGAAKFDGAADNSGPTFISVARNGDGDRGFKKKARTGSLIERTDVKHGIPKTVIETTSSDDESGGSSSPPGSRGSGSRGSGHARTKSDELSPLLNKK